MFRITTLTESESEVLLQVEGRCIGPFVQVLEETLAGWLARNKQIRLRIEELEYVDASAVRLLIQVMPQGVTLEGCRAFVRLQLGLE